MEDKKYGGVPLQDCQAVSEVMGGTVLMISIVVLAFSSVALTIFSEGGFDGPTAYPPAYQPARKH